MPTLDIRGKIKDYEGEVVQDTGAKPLTDKNNKPKKGKDKRVIYPELSWDTVIHRAVNARLKPNPRTKEEGEPRMTQEEKELAHKITTRAYANPKKLRLSQRDIEYLLERIAVIWSPLIYGRAMELLEGKDFIAQGSNDK